MIFSFVAGNHFDEERLADLHRLKVNNAGGGAAGPACEFDIEDAKACFDINLFAPMRLTQLVVPSMAKQRSGLIINIGSVVGACALCHPRLRC